MTYEQVAAMSKWEQAHWIAKIRAEPCLTEMMPILAALQCSVIANSAFGSSGRHKLGNFLIDWNPKPESEELAQLRHDNAWVVWVAECNANALKAKSNDDGQDSQPQLETDA